MGFIPRKPGKSRSFSICSDALRPYLSLFRWIAGIFPYSYFLEVIDQLY